MNNQPTTCRLTLSTGETMQVQQVLLAEGFSKETPGLPLIQSLMETFQQPVSDYCGHPSVADPTTLEWGGVFFVSGALAQLKLGPLARKVAGARMAAESYKLWAALPWQPGTEARAVD